MLGRFLALSILAMGIVLIWGEAGILSLGQGVFFGLGGYALAMHLKLRAIGPRQWRYARLHGMEWRRSVALAVWYPFANAWFSLACVVLVPGAFAAAFSWLVFRRRVGGVYFALITQALALAFSTLLISQQAYTGGFNGLTDFSTLFGQDITTNGAAQVIYLVTFFIVVGVYFGLRWLLATRWGVMLRATRDGENRVRFLGHDPVPLQSDRLWHCGRACGRWRSAVHVACGGGLAGAGRRGALD